MHNVSLDGILNILLSIWLYMTTHGLNLSIGGNSFMLTYAAVMMGMFVLSLVINLVHKIWWEE